MSKTRVWCFDAARTVADQTSGDMTLEVAQFITGAMETELQRRCVLRLARMQIELVDDLSPLVRQLGG